MKWTNSELPVAPKVLLVDDDEVNLLLTSTALRERGFSVTEVTSGREALRVLAEWSPDVLVLDAIMPGMDGFRVCRELRALPGFEMLPVLMLTGLDDDASITRAYDAGATDFFVKSTQWSLLAGRLRYLLRSAQTRMELEASRAKLARAQDLARMGSFEWRTSGRGLVASPEALRVLGLPATARFTVRSLLRMMTEDDRAGFRALMREVMAHTSVIDTDLSLALPDGRSRIVHVEAEPDFSEQGALDSYSGVVQDVTDRRAAEDKIKHLANFDALTGLPNRRQLIWRAERALDQARRSGQHCALLLIDLDRFKVINDTLGHGPGDDLLMEVSRRLRMCVRHNDQIVEHGIDVPTGRSYRSLEGVARLGGDEFVALLPEIGEEADAERVAQRVLESMRDPILIGGQECFVTASVGIAVFPRDGNNVADLLRNADVAMYSVKAAGRNASQLYGPHLAGKGREKLEMESALHKALEREELVLHYQPKVDVRGGKIIGAEALMRWHRAGQLVPPAEFIPMAEETGLIVPMSEWAIREAARQVDRWRRSIGLDASIAVNLPSRVFERGDLGEHIQGATGMHGISADMIEVEITETGLMKDLQDVIPSLHRLNALGVKISIDDFGTGYSSLAYLTSLPITELKIDRSFVRELGVTVQSSAVVSAIIALARTLGLRVIAEGVENLRQMEVLHRLGCTTMQGYLFAKPMTPHDFEHWVQHTVVPRKAPWLGRAEELNALEASVPLAVPPPRFNQL
jgi:predicted signal transduction protein with EAL and GGDEF domain/DNA-binding response OmpR family regulator